MSEHHRWSPGRLSVDDLTTALHTPAELDAYTAAIDARDAHTQQERQNLIAVVRWFFAACSAAVLTAAAVKWLTDWHGVWVFAAGMAAAVIVLAVGVRVLTPKPDPPTGADAPSPPAGGPSNPAMSTEEPAP